MIRIERIFADKIFNWKGVIFFMKLGGFIILFLFLSIIKVSAQTDSLTAISLNEALEKATSNYPKLKASKLKIEQQQALKKTAWDLGNTQVFTGGEELGGDAEGVYTTVGVQQQQMDVFGIAPKLKVQKQQLALAEASLDLSELELRQQVKQAYADAYVARQNLQLYQYLDSIYGRFERAAQLRFEVEETSKLAYLAAQNQVKQIVLQKQQAEHDYAGALQRLNLWLVSDTFYTIKMAKEPQWLQPLSVSDSIRQHPLLQMAAQRVELAEAEKKAARAEFLPKVNAQFGLQEIGGESGYYQYQAGVSIPLFFLPEQGQVQSAKIQQDIAQQELRQTQVELQAEYLALVQEYRKWLASWQFYQQEALPLAQEQREAAILAFREGEIDYVAFIQNLKETVLVEIQAQQAMSQYLKSKFQLEYYQSSNN